MKEILMRAVYNDINRVKVCILSTCDPSKAVTTSDVRNKNVDSSYSIKSMCKTKCKSECEIECKCEIKCETKCKIECECETEKNYNEFMPKCILLNTIVWEYMRNEIAK
jgi:hypothetical protein